MQVAAERLGTTYRTLRRYELAGKIKIVRQGGRAYVTSAEVRRYIERLETEPNEPRTDRNLRRAAS